MAVDFYSLLGLPVNATPDEIRSAYFRLARGLHPDVSTDPASKEKFIEIQKAYETLSSPKRRADYDQALPADYRSAPELSLGMKFSHNVVPPLAEPQLFYALVDIICTADMPSSALPPAHVCFTLDRSTSMQGARMDMVKNSALNLVQQLRPQDMLSVVAFSDRAEVIIPPTRASSLSKSDHRVSLLQTGGGTEILQGLTAGIEQLRQTSSTFMRHLILLTDGHTYGDEEGCLQLARQAAEEGISISVLGIGNEWNDHLMDKISALSGGNAVLINTPRDLDNFLFQKLTELESIYARGLRFEFTSDPGVSLRYAFRIVPNIGPLDTASPMLLGDVRHRKSIALLLEFLLPPLNNGVDYLTLAAGSIWLDIPGCAGPKKRILLDLSRPVHDNPEPDTPPSVIVEALAKLTLYRMQEKVRLEVSEGQIEKATRHMHFLATHLLSQGDRELAHTVLIEAENIQQSRRFSGEGEKRIKYGTRALLLPPGSELKE